MKRAVKAIKNTFIPHEDNGNRPTILRPRTIVFVILIAIVAESIFLVGSSVIAPRSKLFGLILANALVDETNQNRMTNNLPQLQVSPLLQAAAQEKANDMATKNYFAHTSPAGLTPWYWFEQVGYSFTYAGENLAVNFSDSQDVTNAWMNSAEHRANILNTNFTQIGIATAQGTYNGQPAVYVVELFGAPSAAPIAFVNTAAAATVAVPTSPAKTSAGSKTPSKSPAPVKTVGSVPAIVATGSAVNATSAQTFVAVKGASTQTVPTTAPASVTQVSGATTSVLGATEENPSAALPQSNPVQQAASEPRQVVDYFYIAIVALFIVALILNFFIKIRVQHPQLIFGGMLVILIAGLCIILNQHVSLLNATIL